MWPFKKSIRLVDSIKSVSLPSQSANWSLFGKRDTWDTQKAIDEGYNASAVVYAAVEKRAKSLASVPWKAQIKTADGWEDQPDSPLQKLIDAPNPDQSWYDLIYQAAQQLDLSGNAFLSEIKGGIGGLPFELWLLPSKAMSIKPGRERLIESFCFSSDTGKRTILQADMVHLKRPNPDSPYFGMPILKAAALATDIDRESGSWQKASLQNRSVLDLHIEVDPNTTPEQREEVRAKILERQASPANARKPIISSGKITQLGQNAVEMDFNQSRMKVWAEIASCFGVPLAMLGFTENVNLSNAGAMKRLFWEDTIIPELELLKRQLTQQLAYEFGQEWRLEPDLSNISALKEDRTIKLANAEALLRLGYTRNEIDKKLELGFGETDGGDTRFEPSGLIPAGLGAESISDAEAMKAYGLD
jgi:HK97 family phage portal protein